MLSFRIAPNRVVMVAKEVFVLILALLLGVGLYAQSSRANHWAFPRGNAIDFSGGLPNPYESAVPALGLLTMSTSTMSDTNGNLLFYCNGENCWTSNHSAMPNGTGLLGDEETTQSSIIIPVPGNANRYFVFTLDMVTGGNGLNYYIVDMTFNGGFGDVVSPATLLDDTLTNKLCATKHANDLDYWVVAHDWGNNEFQAYHIDTFGVTTTPVISAVGSTHGGFVNGAKGQMKISPDGTRLALANWLQGFVQLFDFDPATGEVSNPLTLQSGSQNFPFGVEFSNDSRKLFVSQRPTGVDPGDITQYDLDHVSHDCLLASEQFIGEPADALKVPSSLQLGADGRIYMTALYFSNYDSLGVIRFPTIYGSGCEFDETGLRVDSAITEGLTCIASNFLSDGIHVLFGTNCSHISTQFFPDDSLGVDSARWNFGDPTTGAANQSTSIEASHAFSAPDTFLVTLITYRGAAADTFQKKVVIWEVPENLLGNDTTICNGNPITLDGAWQNSCVQWSTGAVADQISVSSGGTYWIEVSYQSCLFSDTVEVIGVNGPPQFSLGPDTAVCNNFNFILDPDLAFAYYTWGNGSHDTTQLVQTTGVYVLSATNACGTTIDSLSVTLNITAQPVLNFPNDTLGCDTIGVTFDVSFDNASYLWSDGTSQPIKTIFTEGTFWVQVSNICDTVRDTVELNFNEPLETALAEEALHCGPGDTVFLKATKDNDEVTWHDGSSGSIYQALSGGTVHYTVANACGTLADTVFITAWDTNFSFSLGPDTVLCDGIESTVIGLDTNAYFFDADWSDGSNSLSKMCEAGTHVLTVSNRCAQVADTIRILEAFDFEIVSDKLLNVCEGQVLTLSINAADYKQAVWNSGEIGHSIEVSESGTVGLEVVDSSGCISVDSLEVTALCPPRVFIPNVLTPNGDGENDQWCLQSINVEASETVVFDRWGNKILESNLLDACWDGERPMGIAPAGVYYYEVTVTGTDETRQYFRGHFSLLR